MTVNLNKSNFASTIADNSIVLVDFWASWCGPCPATCDAGAARA